MLGLIMDNMLQKDPQKPHCYFRMRCTHHQTGGLPSSPAHEAAPHPHDPPSVSEQGKLSLVLAPSCCSRGSSKALLDSLVCSE